MRAALAQYQIVGVRTNVEFLGRLMSAPAFVEARLDTALIEREREPSVRAARRNHACDVGSGGAGTLAARSVAMGARPRTFHRGTTAAAGRSVYAASAVWKLREGDVEREVAASAIRATKRRGSIRASAAKSTCSSTASIAYSSGPIPIYR